MRAHVVGNGPSWVDFKKIEESDFAVGCNISKADVDVTTISDIRLAREIRPGCIELNIPVIANEKIKKWLKSGSPASRKTNIVVQEYYSPRLFSEKDENGALLSSAAHQATLWLINKGYDEIHVWGCDSLAEDTMDSHTDELVTCHTKSNEKQVSRVVKNWRKEWFKIQDLHPNVEIILHNLLK